MSTEDHAELLRVSRAVQAFVAHDIRTAPTVGAFATIDAAACLCTRVLKTHPDLAAQFAAAFVTMAQQLLPGALRVEVEVLPTSGTAH